MTVYFIKEWIGTEHITKEFYTEEAMFEYLNNSTNKHISIYAAKCILDWS